MDNDTIEKIKFILTCEGLKESAFKIIDTQDGLIIRFDLHGKSVAEANRLINNLIIVCNKPFFMHIIHGYHHGTAIKSLIWNELDDPRILNIKLHKHNQGESIVKISGL